MTAAPGTPSIVGQWLGASLLALYRGAGFVATPVLSLLFTRRARKGKEDAARRDERFGIASQPRPDGILVWVHAASVGEMNAAEGLISDLITRGCYVLLTTGTTTSATIAARRARAGVIHQFVPYDTPANIARFLAHWRPNLILSIESEIWPATIVEAARRAIPFIVVSATLSPRSARNWQRLPFLAYALFGRIDLVLAQTEGDADRLANVGARAVHVTGNLKLDVDAPSSDPQALNGLVAAVASRRVWLAASTHPGEEELIIKAHRRLSEEFADLLTVIAPRHPERGAEIAGLIAAYRLAGRRRSEEQLPDTSTDIYLADTIGEMGTLLRCADVAFIGKSLVPAGGQNPLEAVRLDTPIVTGAHTFNLTDVYAPLVEGGGAWVVAGQEDLIEAVGVLLRDPHEGARRAATARAIADRGAGALTASLAALKPYLPPVRPLADPQAPERTS